MRDSIRYVTTLGATMLLLLLCGCPPPSGKSGAGKSAEGTADGIKSEDGSDASAYYDGDNVNFKRVNVGLNSQALDLISPSAPLSGARSSSVFFFGDGDRDATGIYERDLATGKRRKLTTVNQIAPDSFNCSNDGSFLAYAKLRPIQTVIDKPDFNYPEFVAELYRYDVASGQESKLFNFGSDYSMYRNDSLYPFISDDGERIICLSYDIHRLLLQTQCLDWNRLYDQITETRSTKTEAEQQSDDDNMRIFLRMDHVAPKLRELGFDPTADTPIDDKARDAVKQLFEKIREPIMALLIWEAGETRTLILKPAAGQERSLHFILAVSGDHILMGAKEPNADPVKPQEIFAVDQQTGQLSPFGSYQGAPSLIEVDGQGKNLVIAYNPFDAETRNIMTETHLRWLPLDGSGATDSNLQADYFGFLDLNADASIMVGQNRDDQWLYRVDTATGEARKLSQHFVDVAGLYLDGPGTHVVFLENGISFGLTVPVDPQSSPDWVDETYFAEYRTKVDEFLALAGFVKPEGLSYRYEERSGMGASEMSIELAENSEAGRSAMFSYDNTKGSFGSMWVPFPGLLKLQEQYRKQDLDYYDCVAITEGIIDRLGWQKAETRESWYPGAAPLYDGKSDSFIVTFRDGYWYDPEKQETWISNSEVTVRIIAKTGDIAEINYLSFPEIHDQPINADIASADFQIRNFSDEPIPEEAPVRFDYENVRLLISAKKPTVLSPGDYASQIQNRIVYEVNAYIQPENELVLGSLVDAETFEVLGRITYMPEGVKNPNMPGPEGAPPVGP
jgi:hypothetical protein